MSASLVPSNILTLPFSRKLEEQLRVDRVTISAQIEGKYTLRAIRVERCSHEFIRRGDMAAWFNQETRIVSSLASGREGE